MAETGSYLKGKHILTVDDEEDVLETIEDILDEATIDKARDYESASQKIQENRYDLAILDIMGVNGLKLLEESVARGIPTVMLTAHAINPETLMKPPDGFRCSAKIWAVCSARSFPLCRICMTPTAASGAQAAILPTESTPSGVRGRSGSSQAVIAWPCCTKKISILSVHTRQMAYNVELSHR